MARQIFIETREFYDRFDEKYEHLEEEGILRRRSDHRVLKCESLRIQVRGQRRVVNAMKFVHWLYTGEITDRILIPIDGNYCNLRFSNLKLKPNLSELLEAKRQEWYDWVYMSEEQRQAYLAAGNKQPQPPC